MAKLSVVLPKGFIGPWFALREDRICADAAYEDSPASSKCARSLTGESSESQPGRAACGSCLSDLSTHGPRTLKN
jgi:hypothetical protein